MMKRHVERAVLPILGISQVRNVLLRAAGRTRRDLILIYHRIEESAKKSQLVPTITPELFREQLVAISKLGNITKLSDILEKPRQDSRIRFAITFDDDHQSHATQAIPVLESLGLQATFFLSGRSLHGLGPYWFQVLESGIEAFGMAKMAGKLGVSTQRPSVAELAEAFLKSPLIQRPEEIAPAPGKRLILDRKQLLTLAATGHEIGFHTLHHPVLTKLSRPQIEAALTDGKAELSEHLGVRLRYFAYPQGHANKSVADLVRRAGFEAAFTNRGYPVAPYTNRHLVGRYDTRTNGPDHVVRSIILRLGLPSWL